MNIKEKMIKNILFKTKSSILRHIPKSQFATKLFFGEDIDKLEVSKKGMDILEEKRILREAEEREQMRKAQELVRQRYEEIQKGNKQFLLKMKIPNVAENPEKVQVYALNNGMFSVNGLWVPGSVLLFPNRFFMWGVVDAHDIKAHTLDLVKVIKPKPTYLIIGTGKYNVEFEDAFYEHFRTHKIIVETMPTFEAVAQFNLCNEDDMDICAALIPDNL